MFIQPYKLKYIDVFIFLLLSTLKHFIVVALFYFYSLVHFEINCYFNRDQECDSCAFNIIVLCDIVDMFCCFLCLTKAFRLYNIALSFYHQRSDFGIIDYHLIGDGVALSMFDVNQLSGVLTTIISNFIGSRLDVYSVSNL